MSTPELIPDTTNLKSLRTELLAIPGVQEVALTTIYDAPETVDANLVANRTSAGVARQVMHTRLPEATALNPVWSLEPVVWHSMLDQLSARGVIDDMLQSGTYEQIAELPHEGWRSGKAAARQDPDNPYQGWGEERIKVRDLSLQDRENLGIRPDADPLADVYHPLDAPLSELGTSVRTRNIVPVVSVLNAMSDFLLEDDSSVRELVTLTDALQAGVEPAKADMVNAIVHIGWMAMDLSFDGNHTKTPENYHTYSGLDPEVRSIDADVAASVYAGLREQVMNPFELWGSLVSRNHAPDKD